MLTCDPDAFRAKRLSSRVVDLKTRVDVLPRIRLEREVSKSAH